MKILRHAFVLGAFFSLLFVSLDTAHAQSLPPRAYLFVEVNDTEGKVIQDAIVRVSGASGERDFIHQNTDKAGLLKSNFYMWGQDHHYNLRVSKPGYLPYEEVFFTYPTNYSDDSISRLEELSNSPEDLNKSKFAPTKIVLRKEPATEEERRAVEAEERKRQLIFAAKRGDTVNLRKLLEAGVEANTVDGKGVPAIAWAALAGEAETIKTLLDAGADVRNRNSPGHQAILIYLSEGIWRQYRIRRPGDYTGETAETILGRHHEIVRRLLEAGAGVNLPQSYRGSVLNKALALMPRLHSPASQYSLSLETIKALLAAGARVKDIDAEGRTPLMVAAQTGSLELVNLLLKAGARSTINARDKKGWTALMFSMPPHDEAFVAGVVKVLIDSGANVNAVNEEGQTALMMTAKGGSLAVVQLLLESGASVHIKDKEGQTALMYASQAAYFRQPYNAEISRLLIRAGASVNEKDAEGRTALMHTSKLVTAHGADVARVLVQEGALVNEKDLKGWTALMYASPKYYNDSASGVVRVLLEAKADVNATNEDGETALMLAAQWHDAQSVKMLIAAGAFINAKDKKGQTVLMRACQSFSPVDIQLFLNAGAAASVNEKDARGWTALMYSMPRYYASGYSRALIAAGADVNAVNDDGQTALMLAAETGSIQLIKTLLELGAAASINARDKQGRTVLMYVKPKYPGDSVDEIIGELLKAGAIPDERR